MSKEDYEAALSGHQAAVDATQSKQRDYIAFHKRRVHGSEGISNADKQIDDNDIMSRSVGRR